MTLETQQAASLGSSCSEMKGACEFSWRASG